MNEKDKQYKMISNNNKLWLKTMGVNYYFSKVDTEQDQDNITNASDNNQQILPSVQIDTKQEDCNSGVKLARNIADKVNTIEDLENSVRNFDECKLKLLSSNTVFSSGAKDAQIMLIGEAPGASEDEQGIPFCGESGKLLDNMLSAINLSRESNVYITNTVFWRPPANRRPTDDEISLCRPFVEKHIALINPKLLILVGSTACTSLLGKDYVISKVRGKYLAYSNQYLNHAVTTTAIFHPAYLLRQPMNKKNSWIDLLKIQRNSLCN
ncbi:MAG: uracil-DNA glycosylase [Rickettsiaceae bacterium]